MSILTTDAKHVALFDTVTGIAFGPIFDDIPEADAFERWAEGEYLPNLTRLNAVRYLSASEAYTISNQWRAFLAEHPEQECPFDKDGYGAGPGWAGDADGEDGIARPYTCDCECHRREGGVFATGRR